MRTSGLLAAVTTLAVLVAGGGPASAVADPDGTETVVLDDFADGTSRTKTFAVPDASSQRVAARPPAGPHRAYVAIATGPGPYSVGTSVLLDRVRAALGYWVEQSDGVVSGFPVAAYGSFVTTRGTVANNCGLGNSASQQVWAEAAALFPGVSFASASANHLIVVLPAECSTSGTVGTATMGAGTGSGGRLLADLESSSAVGTLVHELGHNLGLGHAGSETCSGGACSVSEYGDVYDPMGFATEYGAPALGTAHRVDLALVDSAESPRVELGAGQASVSGDFVLAPRGLLSGMRSVTVVDPATGTEYQVDLRLGVGRDLSSMWLLGPLLGSVLGFASGVTVTARGADATTLLQTRPVTGRPARAAWVAGETFVSRSGGVSVAVQSIGLNSAVVRVTVGAQPYIAPLVDPVEPGLPGAFDADRPVVVGKARVGRTVRVRPDDYPAGTALAVQWMVNGAKLKGATSTSCTCASRWPAPG